MILTSSAIADVGCCLKFDAGPSKYYRYSKARETCISAFENTVLRISSKVYDIQNTAIGQTKHLQQTYQRCNFFDSS